MFRERGGWPPVLAVVFLTIIPNAGSAQDGSFDPELPVYCNVHPQTGQEAYFQIDWESNEVWVAQDAEATAEFYECEGRWYTLEELTAQGMTLHTFGSAILPGWTRDTEGRIFQVAFDLRRRLFLGAAYIPTWRPELDGIEQRAAFDLGFSSQRQSRLNKEVWHRFEVLQSHLRLGPIDLESMLFRWDRHQYTDRPFLRITTFFGTPRRHDVYLDTGFGMDVLGVRYREGGPDDRLEIRWGGPVMSWTLWHSEDFYNYLQLRTSPGLYSVGREGNDFEAFGLSLSTSLEGTFTFDSSGLNNLGVRLGYEEPWYVEGDSSLQRRFGGRLEFERIILAVNDQPVSWHVGVEGYARRLADQDNTGELRMATGLRFSLWAPAPPVERLGYEQP